MSNPVFRMMNLNLLMAGFLVIALIGCDKPAPFAKTEVPDSIVKSDGTVLTPYAFEDSSGRSITKAQYEAANDPKSVIIWQDKNGRTTKSGG